MNRGGLGRRFRQKAVECAINFLLARDKIIFQIHGAANLRNDARRRNRNLTELKLGFPTRLDFRSFVVVKLRAA